MTTPLRFDVYVWWGDRCGWHLRFRNVRQWRLRWRLRRLYGEGWSNLSILVERSEPLPSRTG